EISGARAFRQLVLGAEIPLNGQRREVLEAFIESHRPERIGAERGVRRVDVAGGEAQLEQLRQAKGKSGRQRQQENDRSFHRPALSCSTLAAKCRTSSGFTS